MALVQLLYSLPMPLVVILFIGTAVLLAIAGAVLVRRTVPLAILEANNDFQDFIIGSIGLFYAVLLAFVVFAAWDHYREMDNIIEAEANKIGDLQRNAEGYPDEFGRQMQELLRDYAVAVVEDEWPALARGESILPANTALDQLWLNYQRYEPSTEREKALFAEGLDRLSELREQRRLRLNRGREGIPGILWFALISGGIATICSTYFMGMKHLRSQQLLTATLAGIIAIALAVVFAFDHPFLGGQRLSVDPFRTQIEEAERFIGM